MDEWTSGKKVAAGAVVAIVVAVAIFLGMNAKAGPTDAAATPAATTSPTASSSPGAAAPAPTASATPQSSASAAPQTAATAAAPPPPAPAPVVAPKPAPVGSVGTVSLPPAPTGQPVQVQQGAVFEVTGVTAFTVEAVAPGDISGPGIRVVLKVTNNSDAVVDASGIAVTAQYGDSPASPVSDLGREQLAGEVAPGASATGVYVFQDPDEKTGPLTLRIEYNQSQDVVVITP